MPSDVLRRLLEACLSPPDVVMEDGKLHRFSSSGKRGDDAGWYVFYEGEPAAGAFGDFRTGLNVPSWVANIGRDLSPVEKRDYEKKQEEMRIKREADTIIRRAEAKNEASIILRLSVPASDNHPYLECKNVKAYGFRS